MPFTGNDRHNSPPGVARAYWPGSRERISVGICRFVSSPYVVLFAVRLNV
jgi:hypothetical protein